MSKLEYRKSDEPISLAAIVKRINEVTDRETTPKLTLPVVIDWLVSSGLLEPVFLDGGTFRRRPTPRGEELGIILEERVNAEGPYTAVLYTGSAQQFIVDHLPELIESVRPKDPEALRPFALSPEERSAVKPYDYPVPITTLVQRINRAIDRETMRGLDHYLIINWLYAVGSLKWIESDTGKNKAVPTPKGEELGISWNEGKLVNGHPYTGALYSKAAQQFILDNLDDMIAFDRANRAQRKNDVSAPPPQQEAAEASPSVLPSEVRSGIELFDRPVSVTKITEQINRATAREGMPALPIYAIPNWLVSVGLLEDVTLDNGDFRRRPTPQGEALGIFWKTGFGMHGPYALLLYSKAAQQFVLDNLEAIMESDRSGDATALLKASREAAKPTHDVPLSAPEVKIKWNYALSPEERAAIELSDEPLSVLEILEKLNSMIDKEKMDSLHFSVVNGWLLSQGYLKRVMVDSETYRAVPTSRGEEIGIFWKTGTSKTKGPYSVLLFQRAAQQFLVDHLDDITAYKYRDPQKTEGSSHVAGQDAGPEGDAPAQPLVPSPEDRSAIELSDSPITITDLTERINRARNREAGRGLLYRHISDWLCFVGFLTDRASYSIRVPTPPGEELGILLASTAGPYKNPVVHYNTHAQQFIVDHLDEIADWNLHRKEYKDTPPEG